MPRPIIYARAHLLDAALTEARRVGYQQITRAGLAAAAGVSPALISRDFGTMDELRRVIMKEAVRAGDLKIVAQGLAAKDRVATRAPVEIKKRAAETLL